MHTAPIHFSANTLLELLARQRQRKISAAAAASSPTTNAQPPSPGKAQKPPFLQRHPRLKKTALAALLLIPGAGYYGHHLRTPKIDTETIMLDAKIAIRQKAPTTVALSHLVDEEFAPPYLGNPFYKELGQRTKTSRLQTAEQENKNLKRIEAELAKAGIKLSPEDKQLYAKSLRLQFTKNNFEQFLPFKLSRDEKIAFENNELQREMLMHSMLVHCNDQDERNRKSRPQYWVEQTSNFVEEFRNFVRYLSNSL